jgi:hypothetical protein
MFWNYFEMHFSRIFICISLNVYNVLIYMYHTFFIWDMIDMHYFNPRNTTMNWLIKDVSQCCDIITKLQHQTTYII